MSATSAVETKGKLTTGRSRATNHRDLLPRIKDGRASQARRFRDLVRAFIVESGDDCSEVRIGLLRRLAAATVLSEELECNVVNGEPVNISEFCTLASTTVRLAMRFGINRIPKNVTPTLAQYLDQIHQQQTPDDEEADDVSDN